jgi:hypothetical protein
MNEQTAPRAAASPRGAREREITDASESYAAPAPAVKCGLPWTPLPSPAPVAPPRPLAARPQRCSPLAVAVR